MQKVELPLFGPTLSFSLENFEGPLELLIYLIQREEINLFDIPLKELTTQFFKELEVIQSVDMGADFLWNSSKLLLLKSRLLLPQEEGKSEEEDFRTEILEKLIEYARLKEIALHLFEREEKEHEFFTRSVELGSKKMGDGLDFVTMEDLAAIFQKLLLKSVLTPQKVLKGEEWEIGPKILWLEKNIALQQRISFRELFSEERPKEEWIVFFLAILELMKLQKIKLVKEENEIWLYN